jgi:hypothetical protein
MSASPSINAGTAKVSVVSWVKPVAVCALCVTSLLAGIFALHNPVQMEGSRDSLMNMYRRTKTMHLAANPLELQWTSLLSAQPYVETYNTHSVPGMSADADPGVVAMYHLSDGYFASGLESTDFLYINGESLSILASFAPNVYTSALVFVLLLYSLHLIMAPTMENSCLRLSWMPSLKPYVFGAVILYWLAFECNYVIFNKWNDFSWNDMLTVRYDVEGSSVSVIYAAIVLCLYAFHLCVQSGDCRDLFGTYNVYTVHKNGGNVLYSNKLDSMTPNKFEQVNGNPVSGPVNNDATILGAVTLFFLSCSSIGMSRSVALETEAQLILACVLSIAAIEYLCAKVCSYFWYVHAHYIHQDHMDSERSKTSQETEYFNITQSILLCRLSVFVQTLVLVVNSLLLYILLYVLLSLRPSSWSATWLAVVILSFLYVLYKLYSVVDQWRHFKFTLPNEHKGSQSTHVNSTAENFKTQYETWHEQMIDARHKMFYGQEVLLCVAIAGFLVMTLVLLFTPDAWGNGLRDDEKYQYFSLAESTSSANACPRGVQHNGVLSKIAGNTCSAENAKATWTLGRNTPVDMKVYEWTRWWRVIPTPVVKDETGKVQECTNCQDVDTYFCSTGFEPQFNTCTREYKRVSQNLPGRPVPLAWQTAVKAFYNFKMS